MEQEVEAMLEESDIAELPCRCVTLLLYGRENDTDEKETEKLHIK